MTREEAALKLSGHLMQCGMLMPIEWVEKNGEGSELMEAFKMAQDALREQPVTNRNGLTGWISVKDALPEEAIRVLVRLGGEKPPIGEPRMDTDRVVDGRWVRWFDLVTHWMPMPEPPKEET